MLIRLTFDLINIHSLTHLLTYLTYNILDLYHNENARVSNLPRVNGVESSPPNKFDFDPLTLTYDLDPCNI